jgi:hypothetical protein
MTDTPERARSPRHVRKCDYCGEPVTVRVEPESGGRIYACTDHKKRAIIEILSGAVVEPT